ncbi:TIGR00341 family protein [Hoeflea sp. CAU 1731]
MTKRLIIVTADESSRERILKIAEEAQVLDCRIYAIDGNDGQQVVHLLVGDRNRQEVLDQLQSAVASNGDWRITILPVEASLPREEITDEESRKALEGTSGESREELYNDVSRGAKLDMNFFVFAALSTVVAAIGLLQDNVAVVIGAMVIAPLLGPNLAFALGVALGDQKLMGRAVLTNAAGIAFTLAICIVLGLLLPVNLGSHELVARTETGFDGIALALASGAAAALSLSTGLSSALVGVMVAVALLPPAATVGLMLGAGHLDLALGALTLLAVNIVCLNLSAQLTFVLRGVRPRTWFEKKNAQRAVRVNAAIWFALLVLLTALLLLRFYDVL